MGNPEGANTKASEEDNTSLEAYGFCIWVEGVVDNLYERLKIIIQIKEG